MLHIDSQTIRDIGVFDKQIGIYTIYNRTRTVGGANLLEEMMRVPLSDAERINDRSGIIAYMIEKQISFPFQVEYISAAEQYLSNRDERSKLSLQPEKKWSEKLNDLLAADTQYVIIEKGIVALVYLFQELHGFLSGESMADCSPYTSERCRLLSMLRDPRFSIVLQTEWRRKMPQERMVELDQLFRFQFFDEVLYLAQHIYLLDVLQTVAAVASEKGWTRAVAMPFLPNERTMFSIGDVKHPAVSGAIGNNVQLTASKNVLFLTGANMAGKSTFMKSIGLAIFLAHVGFPVPAKQMQFTVLDGFYSTINLPDNIGIGASHFYAEVLRLKKVAKELAEGKRMLVMFDELFRGTNVKDAEEATIEVAKRFAGQDNSLFIISTHIIEAGEALKNCARNIQYGYLPTRMNGASPVYTYRLEEGITADRHGMIIIQKEGILEMLHSGSVDQLIVSQA